MFLGLLFGLIGVALICFNRQISIAMIYRLPSWMNVNILGMNTRQRIVMTGFSFVVAAIIVLLM